MYRSGKGSANRIKTKSVKVHIIQPWLGCLKCFDSSLSKLMMLSNCVRSLAVLLVQCEHKHNVKQLMLSFVLLAMYLWSDALKCQICGDNFCYNVFSFQVLYIQFSLKHTLISNVIIAFLEKKTYFSFDAKLHFLIELYGNLLFFFLFLYLHYCCWNLCWKGTFFRKKKCWTGMFLIAWGNFVVILCFKKWLCYYKP